MSGLGTGLGITLASIARLAASIPTEEVEVSLDGVLGLIVTQSGDTILTQNDKNIYAMDNASLEGILGIIATESGDTIFTQDSKNLYAHEQLLFVTTQESGGRILTESGDFIITD